MAKWNKETTQEDLELFSDNPEVREERLRRRKRMAGVILGSTVVVLVGGKLGYRAFKSWRVDRNLVEAEMAAKEGEWAEARAKARSVLLIRSADFRALQVWTEALSHLKEPRTYIAAASLFHRPESSLADKLMALRTMVHQAPDAVTLSSFMSLDPEVQESLEFQTALAPIMIRRGRGDFVISKLKEHDEYAENAAARLEIIRALLSKPGRERVEQAVDLMLDLMEEGEEEEALEALLLLGGVPKGLDRISMRSQLPEWVDQASGAKVLHHLFSLHPELAASVGDLKQRDRIFRKAIDAHGTGDPAAVGAWLIRHDQVDKALDFLEEPAERFPDAYISWLHALLKAGHDERLKVALETPPASADLVEVGLVRAVLARRKGDKAAEAAGWTEAMNQAAFDLNKNRFIEIGRYADALDAKDAAADAWVAAVRLGWGAIPLQRDLEEKIEYLTRLERQGDLLVLFRGLLRVEPQNSKLLAKYYYLALIHHTLSPGAILDDLRWLSNEIPDEAIIRVSVVLGLLQMGSGEEALEEVESISFEEGVSETMRAALKGSSLVVAGDLEAGQKILNGLEWSRLTRQERLAFTRILEKWGRDEVTLPNLELEEVAPLPEEIPVWRKALEKREAQISDDQLPELPTFKLPEVRELEGDE
ncbi:MAG: hypothetical protein ACQKBU_10030 [Verrucomicrobiales bacterium]